MAPNQTLGDEGEQLAELLAVEGDRHGRHIDRPLPGPPAGRAGIEAAVERRVLCQSARHHVGEIDLRVRVPAAKRQHGGKVVLQVGLFAVALPARRDLRQIGPARDQEKFAREDTVGRRRRLLAAVRAGLVLELLAHGGGIAPAVSSGKAVRRTKTGARPRPRARPLPCPQASASVDCAAWVIPPSAGSASDCAARRRLKQIGSEIGR